MNIEEIEKKIIYYNDVRYCLPFRSLYYTIKTVCDWIEPINPDIRPPKYIEYFLNKIDFDKLEPDETIEDEGIPIAGPVTPEITGFKKYLRKYLQLIKKEKITIDDPTISKPPEYYQIIYYGLKEIFKRDIYQAISDYKNSISQLTEEQISSTQNKLIEKTGILEEQVRGVNPGIKFYQEYSRLIADGWESRSIDTAYQLLTVSFGGEMIIDLLSSYKIISQTLRDTAPVLSEKPKPVLKTTTENFDNEVILINSDIIDKLHEILKNYFPKEREKDLKKALKGKRISEPLIFLYNQNKFVEVFRRLKYNVYLPNSSTEIKDWICTNFKRRKDENTISFNSSTVYDILTKAKGEPAKKERICIADWLPYKSPSQLQNEAQKEKL